MDPTLNSSNIQVITRVDFSDRHFPLCQTIDPYPYITRHTAYKCNNTTSRLVSIFRYDFLAVQREVAGRRMAGSHFLVGFGIGSLQLWVRICMPLNNDKASSLLWDLMRLGLRTYRVG